MVGGIAPVSPRECKYRPTDVFSEGLVDSHNRKMKERSTGVLDCSLCPSCSSQKRTLDNFR